MNILFHGLNQLNFFGVFLDEHLTWKKHKKYAENKIAKKNIGVLFKANLFLNKRC